MRNGLQVGAGPHAAIRLGSKNDQSMSGSTEGARSFLP
jgi:hypothetical protein